MDCYLTGYEGSLWLLPPPLEWEMEHGMGSPCDAFEASFLYEPRMREMLSSALRFRAEEKGDTLFTGVVDEYEIQVDARGSVVTLRGRGLAALLLDNEAEPAEYCDPHTDFILRRHVYPWGIDRVETGPNIRTGSFSVSGGSSQWRVLEDFCRFGGGVQPRFSKDGVLLLHDKPGQELLFDDATPVTAQLYRESRYGVISEVLVKTLAGASRLVENSKFKEKGGSCRRVLQMPRKTGYDVMRHTGEYQIRRSEEERRICRLTLPRSFAAFPGDWVQLAGSPAGIRGRFRVCRSRCRGDGDAVETVLEMRQEDK